MFPWEFLLAWLIWEPNRAEKISAPSIASVPPAEEFPYSIGPQDGGSWSRSESTGTPIPCFDKSSKILIDLSNQHRPMDNIKRRHTLKACVCSKYHPKITDLKSLKPRTKSFGNFTSAAGLLVLSREVR
jgi:hypothetical protein